MTDHADAMEQRMRLHAEGLQDDLWREEAEIRALTDKLAEAQERKRRLNRAIDSLLAVERAKTKHPSGKVYAPSKKSLDAVLAVMTEQPLTVRQWAEQVDGLHD